jgi:hypothetical protein
VAAKEIAVKKYVVKLSADERERLDSVIHSGKHPAQRLMKARILLKADRAKPVRHGAIAKSPRRWRPASRPSLEPVSSLSRKGSTPC